MARVLCPVGAAQQTASLPPTPTLLVYSLLPPGRAPGSSPNHLASPLPGSSFVPVPSLSPVKPRPLCLLPPPQDPNAYQQLIQKAEDFIAQRALRHIGNVTPQPVVHIVKVGNSGVGIGVGVGAGWSLPRKCRACRHACLGNESAASPHASPCKFTRHGACLDSLIWRWAPAALDPAAVPLLCCSMKWTLTGDLWGALEWVGVWGVRRGGGEA